MGLLPKSPKFFELFNELAQLLLKSSTLLKKNSGKTDKTIAQKARKLELVTDALCHRILVEADSSFITPIDREDIHSLTKSMGTIVDRIEKVAALSEMYKIDTSDGSYKKLSNLLNQTIEEISLLLQLLRFGSGKKIQMQTSIDLIHSLENQADDAFQASLAQLFNGTAIKPLEIIKRKDIYEGMESALNECEVTADIVYEIIIKNY